MKHARSDYDVIQDTSAGVKLAQYIRSLPDGTFQDSHVYELANAVIDPYTPQRIPEDEPVFLIHGQDAVGAATVRIQASLAKQIGAKPDIIRMALDHADKMDDWQKKKTPDVSMTEPPSPEFNK